MIRMPVKYRHHVLMPMKSRRVTKFIKEHKARIRYDRKLKIHFLQLLQEPSGYETQEMTLGIDPGSSFDGFSIVSSDTHHENIELIQRAKKGKTSIKTLKKRQAETRRTRRSRLRHRRARFDNRTSSKIPPTIRANIEFRQWLVNRLLKIYPISKVVIEDVKYNHLTQDKKKQKNGRAFSLVEVGKNLFYNWIRKEKGLELELFNGFNTKKMRVNTFGGDPKVSSKGDKSFEAHCIDSFVLACRKTCCFDPETGEVLEDEPAAYNPPKVKKRVTFIEKIIKARRRLDLVRKTYKSRDGVLKSGGYYKKGKGGVKIPVIIMSNKRNLCRVKINDKPSNHGPEWKYIDHGFSERLRHFKQDYGGTVFKGVKKFFINNEWQNRVLF